MNVTLSILTRSRISFESPTSIALTSTLIAEGRPNEGDIIYMPLMNSFFEIQFVEDQEPFFQLGNLPVYKLSCALFEYNDEDMETGVTAIDSTQAKNAYQVGLDVRCFIMKTADAGNTAFFNPELTRVSQETSLMKEGCLSFPDIYLMIKRSTQVEMKYFDSDGVEHNLILEGLGARCAQHEIDHLNGILFIDHISRLKREMILKKAIKEYSTD